MIGVNVNRGFGGVAIRRARLEDIGVGIAQYLLAVHGNKPAVAALLCVVNASRHVRGRHRRFLEGAQRIGNVVVVNACDAGRMLLGDRIEQSRLAHGVLIWA